jgi:hypothetical protein
MAAFGFEGKGGWGGRSQKRRLIIQNPAVVPGRVRRLDMGGAEYFYERVGRVWSSDPFWYAARYSDLSLI